MEDKEFPPFPNVFSPKINVIARLEYELAHYNYADYGFNNYTTMTPPELR